MAKSGESDPKPGGPRVSAMEVRRRFALVEDLYLRHGKRSDVIRVMRETHGIASRTTDRYLQRVQRRLIAETEADRAENMAKYRAQLRRLAVAAEKEGDRTNQLAALKELAKVDGLYVERHEVTVTKMEQDYGRLTAEELLVLRALRAKVSIPASSAS